MRNGEGEAHPRCVRTHFPRYLGLARRTDEGDEGDEDDKVDAEDEEDDHVRVAKGGPQQKKPTLLPRTLKTLTRIGSARAHGVRRFLRYRQGGLATRAPCARGTLLGFHGASSCGTGIARAQLGWRAA